MVRSPNRLLNLAGRLRQRKAQAGMGTIWVLYLLIYIGFFYVHSDAREIADAELDGYLEVVLLGVPCVVLFGVLVWMSETDIDPDLHSRVVAWTIGVSALFLLAMQGSVFVIEPSYNPSEQSLLLLLGVGFGAAMGAFTGVIETRSIYRGRKAERSAMEARRLEREQDRLKHLNQFLRHEVLNDINKIHGYARLLQQRRSHDDEAEEWVEIMATQSERVAEFVSSIRSLLVASDYKPDLEPVDVSGMLNQIADRVRRSHPTVAVTVDAPESTWAAAGDLLERVFTNLLYNAIEQGGDDLAIRIKVRSDGDEVTVCVQDDGPGVPPKNRDTLFEPPENDDHGHGLFLTRNLVELYGGRLELADTGPEGTRFRVRLPSATVQPDQVESGSGRTAAAC